MRPLPPDATARYEVVVTDDMTVDFGEPSEPRLGKLHPVYATYWLVKHVELVSRKLTLPYLEDGEEGIGRAVSVEHLAPTLPGMRVTLTATLARLERGPVLAPSAEGGPARQRERIRLHADVVAVNDLGDLIGTGRTVQAIMRKAAIDAAVAELRDRAGRGRQHEAVQEEL